MISDYLRRAKAMLASISYKPGWRFEVDEQQSNGYELTIRMSTKAHDAGGSGDLITLGRQDRIPVWCVDTGRFAHEVFRLVHDSELHEAKEWFKVNGVQLYDPHEGGLSR